MKVGVVGLGTMGAPMARHLVEAGHSVSVWNRTASKAGPLVALGASLGTTPAAVSAGWRRYPFERKSHGVETDVTFSGPFLGILIRF